MLKYKLLAIIIFFISLQLNASNDSTEVKERFYFFQLAGGYNYSSFIKDNSEWGGNFSFGTITNIPVYKNFIINPTILFSRLTNTLRNLEDEYFESDYVYRRYYDFKFDAAFIDLILFANYKAYQIKNISFDAGLGIGYTLARENFSKSFNYKRTDQIIRYDPHYVPPEGSINESFEETSSVMTYNADLIIRYSRFSISLIYIIKDGEIMHIDNLHILSILFGIKF
jgi:hypothetical protein